MRAHCLLRAWLFAGCTTIGNGRPADEICAQLSFFQQGPYTASSKPDGLPDRWIEMHWRGQWGSSTGWGLSCTHADDAASAGLCAWLLDNTSFEFAEQLSFDILSCHGYRFPPDNPTWWPWTAGVQFSDTDTWTALDIDFRGWTPEETGSGRNPLQRLPRWRDPVGRQAGHRTAPDTQRGQASTRRRQLTCETAAVIHLPMSRRATHLAYYYCTLS